jgi:uncharacterized protein involved in exopolysaccharide biosynthesis
MTVMKFRGLKEQWRLLVTCTVLFGTLGTGGAFLIPPTFTAQTVILPPTQQQSSSAAMLNSLGSLGSLAGLAGGGLRSPVDQYVALMQSVTVSDRIIEKFRLMDVYDEKYRVDTRRALLKNVAITVGKKDGLIIIEVDDKDPKRAADMANSYVGELKYMTNTLAISEAQQRRRFFEQMLEDTRVKLARAQVDLQESGFSSGALRAEPKAAADGYARLRAEVTAAEVRLQMLRSNLVDGTSEIRQQQAQIDTLRREMGKLEQKESSGANTDYVTRYRDYKYQETLFEMYAKQFELARLDESREGGLIQVVDAATIPEKKSKPSRLLVGLGSAVVGLIAAGILMLLRRK